MSAAGQCVALAAGGTGGHMFPAQALAEALRARGHALALMTDGRGGEVGDWTAGIEVHRISAARIGGGWLEAARGVAALGRGFVQARRILRRLKPGAVVGFGGYPSAPTMTAAIRGGRPTMLHEQNAVVGRANRLLAPRVSRIATSYPAVRGLRGADAAKVVLTGNPVRPEIARLRDTPYAPPAGSDGPIRVLVLGGSQGARILSDVAPAAAARLPEDMRARLAIAQQCRPEDLDRVRAAYREAGLRAELAAFFDDMGARLGAAHLAICRSGASTTAELAAAGRPALLVPYPHATDGHQAANAQAIADAGGGWAMPQEGFTAPALAGRLETLFARPDALAAAAAKMRAAGIPDAADRLAEQVELLLDRKEGDVRDRRREAA